jgi:uncharacterized protein
MGDDPRTAVCIFAKPPTVGEVKTRLASAVGPEAAAQLAAAFLRDTLDAVRTFPWAHTIVASTHPDLHGLVGDAMPVWLQGAGDLGARIERILARALTGHATAVALGADSPATARARLGQARAALHGGADAVIGPTEDGGFDVLGLQRCPEHLFRDLPWSDPTTCARTLERLEGAGMRVVVLDPGFDVDRPSDLPRLRRLLEGAPHLAPATWKVLADLGDGAA